MSHKFRLIMGMMVTGFIFSMLSCAAPEKSKVEAVPSPVTVEDKQKQLATLPPPDLENAQATVKRIFKGSVAVESSSQPSFLAGDFNGDLSQDLAVVVKPVPGRLADLNEEFPAWLLRDPFIPTEPGTPPLKVEDNEMLLAIIHGFGADGWKDPQATQTFLLKNAVGAQMGVQSAKSLIAASSGKAIPGFHGDLITEVLRDRQGYLYYSVPTYSWYDPKTYKPENQIRMVHGGSPAAKR